MAKVKNDFLKYEFLIENMEQIHLSPYVINMENKLKNYVIKNKLNEFNMKENHGFISYYGGLKSGCMRGLKKEFKEKLLIVILKNDNFDKSSINSISISELSKEIFNEKIDNNSMSFILKELQIEKAKRNFCFEYDKKFFTDKTIKKLNSVLENKKEILDDMIKKIVISFEEEEERTRKKI